MAVVSANVQYTHTNEWISKQDDGSVLVGISDYAQDSLGDIVYLELPDTNLHVDAGSSIAVIESVKTAADIYSPVTGTVIAINDSVVGAPEQINENPYEAWLFCIQPDENGTWVALLSIAEYEKLHPPET